MLLQCTDEEKLDLAKSLRLDERKSVLIPVNDSCSLNDRGMHWSLLIFHRDSRHLDHYDSSRGYNHKAADRVAKVFGELLSLQVKVNEVDSSPQQSNGYDCGMFVLLTAEWFVRRAPEPLMKFVTQKRVDNKRDAMMDVLLECMSCTK